MTEHIVTTPNTSAGRMAVNHLREFGGAFGVRYLTSLSDTLDRYPERLRAAQILEELPYQFHLIEIAEEAEPATIARILRQHSDPTGRIPWRGYIDAIEPNVRMELSALGTPFTSGDKHASYLQAMNVSAAHGGGASSVKVAVLDTGSDNLSFVTDFYDLTGTSKHLHPGRANQTDTDGHGTAMATLVHEVARAASIDMIRIADSAPEYMHVLAGLAIAVCDCKAEIVNLSIGFKDFGGVCGACGSNAVSRAIAMEKMLRMLIDLDPAIRGTVLAPVFVAATGNADVNTSPSRGFCYPAAFDDAVAVGSVNSGNDRSSFSNYGTAHAAYLVAPGGEEPPLPAETVGHGSTGDCFGTSVATAYVSGVLALMRQDHRYSSLDHDDLVRALLQMCTVPAGGSALEFGRGVLRYA